MIAGRIVLGVSPANDRIRSDTRQSESSAVSNYREYVDAYGLGWKVDRHAGITVPAFKGSLDLRYAEVDD